MLYDNFHLYNCHEFKIDHHTTDITLLDKLDKRN